MADSDIAVAGLTTTGGLSVITAYWSFTDATSPLPYLQFDHFEVWVATSNDRSLATKAADTFDMRYPLTGLGYAVTRYFWVRAVDYSGNLGDFYPLGSTAGIAGTTRDLMSAVDLADGSISMAKLLLSDPTNLVQEPGFEYGGSGWNITSNSYFALTDGTEVTRFIQMSSGSGILRSSSLARIRPGDELMAVALVRRSSAPTGNLQFRVRYTLADGSVSAADTLTLDTSNVSTSVYTRLTLNSTAPANAAFVQIDFLNNLTAQFMRVAYTGLFRRANFELVVDGAIRANHVQAASLTGDRFQANTVSVRELYLGDFSNLLPDSALSNFSLWVQSNMETGMSVSFVASPVAGSAGGMSILWSGASTDAGADGYVGILSFGGLLPVEPGAEYAGGFYSDPNSGATGKVELWAQWYDKDLATVSFSTIAADSDVSTHTGRQSKTGIVTAPATASFVKLSVRRKPLAVSGSIAAAGTYVDSIYLRRAAGTAIIPDGAVVQSKAPSGSVAYDLLAVGAGGLVQTVHINAAAVTDPISSISTSGTIPYSSSYQTVESIVVTTGAYPIPIGAYLDFTTYNLATTNTYDISLEITIGGTSIELDHVTLASVAQNTRTKSLLRGTVPPLAAGSYTVRLRLKSNVGAAFNHTDNYSALAAGSVKK